MKRIVLTIATLGIIALYLWGCGTNTTSSVSGGRVQTSHINQYYTALNQDVVPRNSSGAPTNLGGSLGSSTYKWLKSWVESGYWKAGDLKMHHSYNGTVTCGQGWMLADGDIINLANYDADTAAGHTAGDWAIYVGTSPLDGKYTPNMTGRYATGAAATTQTGSGAITAVGNASNQVDLTHTHGSHTHTQTAHSHHWYFNSTGVADSTWDSSGSAISIGATTDAGAFSHMNIGSLASPVGPGSHYYTDTVLYGAGAGTSGSTTPSSALSATQSIRPDSIEVQYCIRVID